MGTLYPVIIAGGSGTRFWPVSRGERPKQFQPIVSERTMIEETLRRAAAVSGPDRTLVIASAEHAKAIEETCREVPPENLILEPFGRDTAPAVGLAARLLVERDPGASMLVLPADHRIEPTERFRAAVETGALRADEQGELVTFGIVPDHPATGYGYLQRGKPLGPGSPLATFEVAAFCEKPDLETAKRFLEGGEHRWNSGIFLWRADRILEEIGRHLPDLAAELDRLADHLDPTPSTAALTEAYGRIERVSIDYGVMEKADRVSLVEVDFEWDDVGSWEALARHLPTDRNGHHIRGELEAIDCRDLIVVSPSDHLVGAIGVEGLAIVATEGATLICPRDRVQEVKQLVERLHNREGGERWR